MLIEIRPQPFEPWREVDQYQDSHLPPGGFGACAVFVGTMRDFNQSNPAEQVEQAEQGEKGEKIKAMSIEHYAGMTERQLTQLVEETIAQHGLLDVLLLHRIGDLRPNEPIVLVAVWSAHRSPAFKACREIMETLKTRATFWKKETLPDGERWVAGNTAADFTPGD